MTNPNEPEVDWNLTTWKGARRKQHQDFHAIPFSRKLEIIEEMNRHGLATLEERRHRGLAFIDPFTNKLVPGISLREESSDALPSPGNSETR